MPALQYILKIYLSLTLILEYDPSLEWSQFVALRQRISFFQLFCRCVETHSDDDGDFSSKYDCDSISQLLPLSLWYTIGVSKIILKNFHRLIVFPVLSFGQEVSRYHYKSNIFAQNRSTGWFDMGEQGHTSEEQHYNTIDSGQGQRWSFMTFLYLSVSSSCYQVVPSSKYSTRCATLGYHTPCMCASLLVSVVLINCLAISVSILCMFHHTCLVFIFWPAACSKYSDIFGIRCSKCPVPMHNITCQLIALQCRGERVSWTASRFIKWLQTAVSLIVHQG